MRLERVVPAVAIVLSLLASSAPALATSGASAEILSPGEGATIGANAPVEIRYVAANGTWPRHLYGHLTLDGEWAGGFSVMPLPGPGGPVFRATLRAEAFAAGPHALGAVVFTDEAPPVTTPEVQVVLDLPARVAASAWYDVDARRLHVATNVTDEAPVVVALSAGANGTQETFLGERELVLSVAHAPGNYTAKLVARDSLNQTTSLALAYVVGDRPADVEILEALYEVGGILRLRAGATDADGGLRGISITTPLGSGFAVQPSNGSWEADVRVSPRLGTHNGTLTTKDAYGGTTSVPFSFVVGGAREVIFEREVSVEFGAHGNLLVPFLPRVHEGLIEICVQGCRMNTTHVGSALVATVWEGVALTGPQAPRVCASTGVNRWCPFEIQNPAGWNLDLVWAQAYHHHVLVRVSGVRV